MIDDETKDMLSDAIGSCEDMLIILNGIEPKLDRSDQMRAVTMRKELRVARAILTNMLNEQSSPEPPRNENAHQKGKDS